MSEVPVPLVVPPFHLPFDEKKPVLICGADGTGKTGLARHLIEGEPTRRPVVVIDAAGSPYGVPGKRVEMHTPRQYRTDAEFFSGAAAATRAFMEHPGVLVVDGLDLLATPYSDPMPGQVEFLTVLATALRTMRMLGSRVLVTSTAVPGPTLLPLFGIRILLGTPEPGSWPSLFGGHIEPGEVPRYTGTIGLDGQIYPVAFPFTEPHEQVDEPVELPRRRPRWRAA